MLAGQKFANYTKKFDKKPLLLQKKIGIIIPNFVKKAISGCLPIVMILLWRVRLLGKIRKTWG